MIGLVNFTPKKMQVFRLLTTLLLLPFITGFHGGGNGKNQLQNFTSNNLKVYFVYRSAENESWEYVDFELHGKKRNKVFWPGRLAPGTYYFRVYNLDDSENITDCDKNFTKSGCCQKVVIDNWAVNVVIKSSGISIHDNT